MCLLFCNQCVCLCVWGQLEMPLCRSPCVFIVCLLFTKQRLRVCVRVCVCVSLGPSLYAVVLESLVCVVGTCFHVNLCIQL